MHRKFSRHQHATVEERLWAWVDKTDTCWPRAGAHTQDGYSVIQVDGRALRAHCLVWEWTHGPIPPGMVVAHHCDNPPCVRLDHLFLTTPAGNTADMVTKGRNRTVRGEAHGMAKLTPVMVEEIRHRLANGETGRALAAEFGIGEAQVSRIKHGKRW